MTPRATPLGVATAVWGAARYKLGWLIVRLALRRARRLSPDERLRSAWRLTERLKPLFRGRADFRNRFDTAWRPNVFFDLILQLSRDPHGCAIPVIEAEGLDDGARPVFVATVHGGLVTPMIGMLQRHVGGAALIRHVGQDALLRRLAPLYGVAPYDKIDSDEGTFLKVRQALRRNHAVLSCIDYTERVPGGLCHEIWISSAMFEMALRLKAEILYALPLPRSDGSILIRFERPSLSADGTAEELAQDFVTFLSRHWPFREPRNIAPLGRRQRQGKLRSGMWLPSKRRPR